MREGSLSLQPGRNSRPVAISLPHGCRSTFDPLMPWTYDHPHPAVTVDIVLFSVREGAVEVLLIRRARPPFEGAWALPGGFVGIDEGLEAAAHRELREETGIEVPYLEQLYAFGDPERDPRERVISVAWFAHIRARDVAAAPGSDAAEAHWFDLDDLPELAFDHADIVRLAREHFDAGRRRG